MGLMDLITGGVDVEKLGADLMAFIETSKETLARIEKKQDLILSNQAKIMGDKSNAD